MLKNQSYVGDFTNTILENYIRKCDKYVWKLRQNYVAKITLEFRHEVTLDLRQETTYKSMHIGTKST